MVVYFVVGVLHEQPHKAMVPVQVVFGGGQCELAEADDDLVWEGVGAERVWILDAHFGYADALEVALGLMAGEGDDHVEVCGDVVDALDSADGEEFFFQVV